MKLSQIFFLICLSTLWTQCAQELDFPTPFEGEPVFTASAIVGEKTLNLAAGIDNYYMFTSFEKDDQNVFVFKGELKQETCPSACSEQLRIEIRDNHVAVENETDIEDLLSNSLEFASPVLPSTDNYRVHFQATSNDSDPEFASYTWNFGDGNFSTEINPIHEYTQENTYEVTLEKTDSSGCIGRQTQVIDLSNLDHYCSIFIEGVILEDQQVQLEAISTIETTNNVYIWNADSSYFNPILIFETGTYCVQLEDMSSCESTACAGVIIHQNSIEPATFCTTSFGYEIENISLPPINPLQLATVTMSYTDENGQEYRSDLGPQTNAEFNIVQVEDFDLNEHGEMTKKISLTTNCLLYHENGAVLELLEGAIVFGIAHP